MRTITLATLAMLGLTACGDTVLYVCSDVLEEGEGPEMVADFVGVEVCYDTLADPKTCEDEGGTATPMGDYGSDPACLDLGFTHRCGQVAAVKNAEDCPEGYEVVELE